MPYANLCDLRLAFTLEVLSVLYVTSGKEQNTKGCHFPLFPYVSTTPCPIHTSNKRISSRGLASVCLLSKLLAVPLPRGSLVLAVRVQASPALPRFSGCAGLCFP